MVPSGYKEDTVYSVVPSDGSGDLTFTRASNGTRVNSAGLVEVCPWNLLQQSETFDNATWQKSGIAVTANSAANPLTGLTNADNLVAENVTNFHYIYQPITYTTDTYTIFVYLKANGYNWFVIDSGLSNKYSYFNLSTGVLGTAGSGATASIESVGNGWYKCGLTYAGVASSAGIYLSVRNADNGGSFTGNGTGGVLAYGAQLNIGSTAKPYFPTTDRLNVPRLTYQNGGGGCPSLLLEKQSTNLATQSTITSFGSGSNDWLNGAGSPASINQTTGIDGTQNGTKYTRTAGQTTNDFFYKNQVPVTSGTTYTVSGYIKLGTASNAVVVINNTAAWNSVPNGSIVCSTANGFSTTEWKRFELTITGPSTNQINIHYGYHEETGVTAQANGTFFLDGLQVEPSSYATSLIPTNGSSATRVADSCFKTGISSLIGQSEGTLFADFVTGGLPSIDQYYMNISDGSTSNIVYIGFFANILVARVIDAGSLVVNINVALATNTRYKVGFAYKANDCILYINGSNSGSDTSASIPACSKLSYNDFSNEACYQLNESVLFKTRLTNAELASLTTI